MVRAAAAPVREVRAILFELKLAERIERHGGRSRFEVMNIRRKQIVFGERKKHGAKASDAKSDSVIVRVLRFG